MAALADKPLARLQIRRRTHRLDRQPVFVKGLEEQLFPCRDCEMSTAVFLHRHRTENVACQDY
jgi:hypothetical protein